MSADQDGQEYLHFRCKSCGKKLKINRKFEGGHVVPCPGCGEMVTVPFANIEKIAEYKGLEDDSGRRKIDLDPDALRQYLKEEGLKKQAQKESAWSPKSISRVEELSNIRATLNAIEQDVLDKVQSLYTQKDISEELRKKEVERIAKERQQEIRRACLNRKTSLMQKKKILEDKEGVLNATAQRRLEQLTRSLQALDLYLNQVLKLEI